MTNKRFKKLCMGLGISKHDVEYINEQYSKHTNEVRLLLALNGFISYVDFVHPAYIKKAEIAERKWLSGEIGYGELVRVIGRCYRATKDMIQIDNRKRW